MSASMTLYGGFLQSLANKQINLNSDTIKVMLLTSAYTPSDAHRYQSDLTNEVSGAGYTAGGATLGSQAVSYASGVLKFTGANVQWLGSSITARYAVLVDATPGSSATNPVIAYADFGADETDTNGTFQINWNASGIFTITHS